MNKYYIFWYNLVGFGWYPSIEYRNKREAIAALKRYRKRHPEIETYLQLVSRKIIKV